MNLSYKKQVGGSFDDVVKKTKEQLALFGFGVITEIDAKKTFKNKLNVEFENYLILGACHPASALRVLQTDKELGLMLPCNVLVYQEGEAVIVSTILPSVALGITGHQELENVAQEIEAKLKAVVDAVC